jgi:hypothetical protein
VITIAPVPQIETVIVYVRPHALQIVDLWEIVQIPNVPVIVTVLMRPARVTVTVIAFLQIVEAILNVNVIVLLMFVIVIWFQIVRQYRQDRWAKIVFVIREVIVHVLVNVILRLRLRVNAAGEMIILVEIVLTVPVIVPISRVETAPAHVNASGIAVARRLDLVVYVRPTLALAAAAVVAAVAATVAAVADVVFLMEH